MSPRPARTEHHLNVDKPSIRASPLPLHTKPLFQREVRAQPSMALPKVPTATGLLRHSTRPAASRASLPQLRRKVTRGDGDLGGPGGQQPPPPNPGGPEAVKRNWVPIGGAALAAVAAYAYLTTPKVDVDRAKQTDARNPSQAELRDLAAGSQAAEEVVQQVADQATKTMKEMSGRRKTDQGSFRHD
ncbi:uncharacterized protein MAM_07181 [Metarhizium album ARSEF 1941]|uniref:Uncharacterized protein n=1 Tax=Metarhizium album (strain ARSEF 1941) TaxID=1081103 RepID=A0A0B2WMM4_METAS|nr:uncharacterized protein MAM_07181 [Metarhizium album ARSEF 1941]KHN94954.1 hypothetical protein MAM_07181 [Metarhizium album ARSEF 1941]